MKMWFVPEGYLSGYQVASRKYMGTYFLIQKSQFYQCTELYRSKTNSQQYYKILISN